MKGGSSPAQVQIATLWNQGELNQNQIAKQVGVTRQYVALVVGQVHELIPADRVFPGRAARDLDLPLTAIRRWIKAGDLNLQHGRVSESEAKLQAIVEWTRACRVCGKPRQSYHAKSCPEHRGGSAQYASYPYRLWSDRRKKRFRRLLEAWRERNPERSFLLQKRASMVWRLINEKGLNRPEARAIARRRVPYPWQGQSG